MLPVNYTPALFVHWVCSFPNLQVPHSVLTPADSHGVGIGGVLRAPCIGCHPATLALDCSSSVPPLHQGLLGIFRSPTVPQCTLGAFSSVSTPSRKVPKPGRSRSWAARPHCHLLQRVLASPTESILQGVQPTTATLPDFTLLINCLAFYFLFLNRLEILESRFLSHPGFWSSKWIELLRKDWFRLVDLKAFQKI
jgi:hypothetical protein